MRLRFGYRARLVGAIAAPLLVLTQVVAAQAAFRAQALPVNAVAASGTNVAATTRAGTRVTPIAYRGDVRHLPHVNSSPIGEPDLPTPSFAKPAPRTGPSPAAPYVAAGTSMPSPSASFQGMSYAAGCGTRHCGTGWPPDANGDVGPTNYIEAVNTGFMIYSKTGGYLAAFMEDDLFAATGPTPCNGSSEGDPVVLYDTLTDHWILTNFAWGVSGGLPVGPYYQCIAVSMTGDPVTGGWWLYAIQTDLGADGTPPSGTLNDYAKFGLWTDCLYYAANGFSFASNPNGAFTGTEFASFSRSDLESGQALTWSIGFIASPTGPFTMIPGNLRAPSSDAMPPPGTPEYFVSESTTDYAFEVRTLTAGPNCGSGGSLSAPTVANHASYGSAVTSVPQPGTTVQLDTVFDRLMQKVEYRRVGDAESLWVVHTVDTPSNTVAPQWAQLDVTGGHVATTPVQQQVYAPDTTLHRWMGSIAADHDGNVALGYSTSNGTSPNYPSIAYAGRLATDPLNTMPQAEVQLRAGGGSQTSCGGAPCGRWGDYSSMSVDPVDDCTFWYVNEFYTTQVNGSTGNWETEIGSFRFPTCGVPTISSINPASGPPSGGTSVAITGRDFIGVTAVTFGATPAASFTVNSPTSITATSPAGSVGSTGVTVTNAVGRSGRVTFSYVAAPSAPTGVTGLGGNSIAWISWSPPSSSGTSAITGYTVTSSPDGLTCTTVELSCAISGLTNRVAYTFTVTASNAIGMGPASEPSAPVIPISGGTYVPMTPTRVLDTRNGTGLAGAFGSGVARTFQVVGNAGVPVNAVAMTGNLTVTQQTHAGYIALGPVAMNAPTTSTLNFPLGDARANGVTVPLGAGGTLSATYITGRTGDHTALILDVTGYFVPNTSGATYVPLAPARILDTRVGNGLTDAFASANARTFQVTGRGGVPANAIAVTGNLTVTQQTRGGYVALGPVATDTPGTSTLNFPLGDNRANGVTVPLGSGGTLSATYITGRTGDHTALIFDVTGYFVPGVSGAGYSTLIPSRVLDTRVAVGLGGPFYSGAARTFAVATDIGLPGNTAAVTGNLTVTQQTRAGYVALGPVATNTPTTSTLNFPLGDARANGVTVPLGPGGTLSATYITGRPGDHTAVILDVTGYFAP